MSKADLGVRMHGSSLSCTCMSYEKSWWIGLLLASSVLNCYFWLVPFFFVHHTSAQPVSISLSILSQCFSPSLSICFCLSISLSLYMYIYIYIYIYLIFSLFPSLFLSLTHSVAYTLLCFHFIFKVVIRSSWVRWWRKGSWVARLVKDSIFILRMRRKDPKRNSLTQRYAQWSVVLHSTVQW